MENLDHDDDSKLTAQITDIVKAIDAHEAAVEITRKEKQITLGKLLAEAQRRHPTDEAFALFLNRFDDYDLGIRRAKDLIRIALDPDIFDKHQAANAAAQQRYRDKVKAAKKAEAKAEAKLVKDQVPAFKSETTLIKAKAEPEHALLSDSNASTEPEIKVAELIKLVALANPEPEPEMAEPEQEQGDDLEEVSDGALASFELACERYLPLMNEANLKDARAFVMLDGWDSKSRTAVAEVSKQDALQDWSPPMVAS